MTVFAPLSAIHRPQPPTDKITRLVDSLGVDSGVFSVRAHSTTPLGLHQVDLLLETPADVDTLKTFFNTVRGRWKPIWLPSFQEDFVLAAPIAADDTTILIQSMGYATHVWPTGPPRRHIAFVLPDQSFYMRYVSAAVDNGDGTETLTITELGAPYAIPEARGMVSYLWYCRLDQDNLPIRWTYGHFGLFAEAQLTLVDLLEAPTVGGGPGSPPTGDDLPPPCTEEITFIEGWEYEDQEGLLDSWPVTSVSSLCIDEDDPFIHADEGEFRVRIFACGIIGSPGNATHQRILAVDPGDYRVSAAMSINPAQGLNPSKVRANGQDVAIAGPGSPGQGSLVVTSTGTLTLEIFLSVPYNPGVIYEVRVLPIIVERVC